MVKVNFVSNLFAFCFKLFKGKGTRLLFGQDDRTKEGESFKMGLLFKRDGPSWQPWSHATDGTGDFRN